MFSRRSFLALFGLVHVAAAQELIWNRSTTISAAQEAVMQGDKAIACENGTVTCPNGHKTCRKIDAPLAIGNDSYQNPECVQLREFHLLRCDVCHVLFTRE